jgi:hypothetical protein
MTDINAGMLNSVLVAGKRIEAREREGMPDLPTGHPALNVLRSKRQAEALGEEHKKVRKSKKVGNAKPNEDKKKNLGELMGVMEKVAGLSKDLDGVLKQIHELSGVGANMCEQSPGVKMRFLRIARMVASFHTAITDCCEPLSRMATSFRRGENMEGGN